MKVALAPWYVLFCLFAVSQSTETVYTCGLPVIAREMNVTGGEAQFTSSIYFFGFTLGIFVLGRLSDFIGRRPVLLSGLLLYLVSCALAIFARDIKILIILRFFQAFGASVGSVVAQAIARDCYKGTALANLFATLSIGLSILPALGSYIGGNIVQYYGWRYSFLFLFVIMSFVLVLCTLKLPETNTSEKPSEDTKYTKILMRMLRDKSLLCYAVIIGCFNGIFYSIYAEAPFIFIVKMNVSSSLYGGVIFLMCLFSVLGSYINRQLLKAGIDNRRILQLGLLISLISCQAFFAVSNWWDSAVMIENYDIRIARTVVLIPMLFQAISYSLTMPIVLRYALENYSSVNGTAGSIFGGMYYLIVALVSLLTSKLHSDVNFIPIATMFMLLSIICNAVNKMIKV